MITFFTAYSDRTRDMSLKRLWKTVIYGVILMKIALNLWQMKNWKLQRNRWWDEVGVF